MMILTDRTGRQFSLQVGDNLIGRGSDCQLRLEHERVSRHHAVIQWDGHQAHVTDMNSTNGTSLNGRRLEPQRAHPLAPGDRLEMGGPEAFLEVAPVVPDAAGASAGVPAVLPAPASQPARAFPVWLAVLGGVVVLLLAFGLAALWSANRSRQASTVATADAVTPVVEAAAEQTAPAAPAPAPTATLAVPAVGGSQGPSVNVGGGAAAPAAAAQLPPLNPTTLPGLIASATGGILPGDLTAFLGGTPIPGLPAGTPGVTLPAGPKRHSPPRLLNPASGSSYQGENAIIILEWEAVDGLAANEYYWVMVFYKQNGQEQAGGTWVKATSYRVPAWFLTQAAGRFEWQVVIAEATGPVEQGGRLGATVSDPSERRWFEWNAGGGVPQPAPTPTYGG